VIASQSPASTRLLQGFGGIGAILPSLLCRR
jgi:hypothetical protein